MKWGIIIDLYFEQLEEALLGEQGFIIQLRMLEGFDEQKYKEVCLLLEKCATEFKTKEHLPKKWVGLLVEICPAVLMYVDHEYYCSKDENWNIKIWDAYLKLYDLVLDCCA